MNINQEKRRRVLVSIRPPRGKSLRISLYGESVLFGFLVLLVGVFSWIFLSPMAATRGTQPLGNLSEQYLVPEMELLTSPAALDIDSVLDAEPEPASPEQDAHAGELTGLDALARERADVQLYKSELASRLSKLESILEKAIKLDLDDSSADRASSGRKRRLGMGGSDVEHAPMISMHGKSASSGHADTLTRFDAVAEYLRILPLGSPVRGNVSSHFGRRTSPFSYGRHFHSGIDIAVDSKTPIVATGDGLVIMSGPKGQYGKAVLIRHGKGFETLYGHMSKVFVRLGEYVHRGQVIGLVGSSGRSTGPHVHYEVRKSGTTVNPWPYVQLVQLLRSFSPVNEVNGKLTAKKSS